jgi:uncharacterized protein
VRPSRFNILSRATGSGRPFVVNPLSGRADWLEEEEAKALGVESDAPGGAATAAGPLGAALALRGYLVHPDDEAERYESAYAQFLAGRATDEVQLFYAPSYACNFACAYCYQDGYGVPEHGDDLAVADGFFAYLDQAFAGRSKYVTLFGGEPLLPDERSARVLQRFVDSTAARSLDLAVVTNGYHLARYLPMLRATSLREIQVTLDGPEAVHDARRPLRGGGGTFAAVVAGIDACLAADVDVNLRVVVDGANLAELPALADFAEARGWTSHERFKTQLGRNYELHRCHRERAPLLGRLELGQALFALYERHPRLLDFHRPSFSLAAHLFARSELPSPLFDACPGCKTEWAFDYAGRIYSCTATVGKPGEELGRFHPEVTLDRARIAHWQARDVRAIDACRSCALQLACGGGCASLAKNRAAVGTPERDGARHAPDCRPVRELLELGFALYGAEQEEE